MRGSILRIPPHYLFSRGEFLKSVYLLYFVILTTTLYSSDIYSIYFDSKGEPHRGEWVLSLNDTQDSAAVLSEYLGFGKSLVRKYNSLVYISSQEGSGYIPILTFHKLGSGIHFELRPRLFEELLIYLNENNFYVISDYQYLTEDYTRVEKGKKLIVLGSDDASTGTFSFNTLGDHKTGTFIMNHGTYEISHDSMVYFLNRYLPEEEGRRNFTFYLTFDAIPFRQTGGGYNPGPPYKSMFAVLAKLKYLENNYIIGNHTANHLFSEELSESNFVSELNGFYDIMDSYGVDIRGINTLAYPFGIGDLTDERQETVQSYRYGNATLKGAFDYNGYFAKPLSSGDTNGFDVSRVGVDNNSYVKIKTLLGNTDIFKSRRAVIIESENYLFDLPSLDLNSNDSNYILIRN